MQSTTIVLVLFVAAGALAGVLDPLLRGTRYQSAFSLCLTIAFAILIFAWYYFDSDRRHYKRSPVSNLLVVAIAIVGVPYYLFRSRGGKGGAVAMAYFLLFALAWLAAIFVGLLIGTVLSRAGAT